MVAVPWVVVAFLLGEVGVVLVMVLVLLGALVACPAFAVIALVQRKRETWVRVGSVALLAIACFASARVYVELRRYGVQRAAERAQVVIDAIEEYHSDRGEYPRALDELVPEYLPEVPSTGMTGYPRFEYTAPLDDPSKAEPGRLFETYELGVNLFKLLQFDRFVYWPEDDYPDAMYGGGVERIGAWAYVHE